MIDDTVDDRTEASARLERYADHPMRTIWTMCESTEGEAALSPGPNSEPPIARIVQTLAVAATDSG